MLSLGAGARLVRAALPNVRDIDVRAKWREGRGVPVPSTLLGTTSGVIEHRVDSRWTMAYSAGIGDLSACYLDTRPPTGVVAHPMFVHCLEWPAVVSVNGQYERSTLTVDEIRRGVHATHDTVIHHLVRPGSTLRTTATVIALERRTPGVYQTILLETVAEDGRRVATTWMGGLFLGVDLDGEECHDPSIPSVPRPHDPTARPRLEQAVPVAANAAHVYTECARIWNPIHTDAAVAQAAGLPGTILHGSATLATTVSQVVDREAGGDPTRVRRIACRFGAMVAMPSTLRIRITAREPLGDGTGSDGVWFEVLTDDGGTAVRNGLVVLRDD